MLDNRLLKLLLIGCTTKTRTWFYRFSEGLQVSGSPLVRSKWSQNGRGVVQAAHVKASRCMLRHGHRREALVLQDNREYQAERIFEVFRLLRRVVQRQSLLHIAGQLPRFRYTRLSI